MTVTASLATEAEYESTIIEAARLGGWLVHGERPARSARGWRTPIRGHAGWPDLFLVHPDGRCLALEHDVSTAARPRRAAEVEAAYKAEQRAAAVAGREPTISYSTVQQAEAAEADHAAALRAAAELIGRRNMELYNALRTTTATAAVLHALARERQRLTMNGVDPRGSTTAAAKLHVTMLWPPIAYRPVVIDRFGRGAQWWPLELGGWAAVAWASFAQERLAWNEWAWEQLAERKGRGFTVDDDGVLQFRGVWDGIKADHRAGVDRLVMFGVGPHGEQGAGPDDLEQRPGHIVR